MRKVIYIVWICIMAVSLLVINQSSAQALEADFDIAGVEEHVGELSVSQLIDKLNGTQFELQSLPEKYLTDNTFEFETNPFETPCLPSYVCRPSLECQINPRTHQVDCSSKGFKCELGCSSQQ